MTGSLYEQTGIFRAAAYRVNSVFVYEQTYVGNVPTFECKFESVADFIFAEPFIIVRSAESPFPVFSCFGYRRGLQRYFVAFGGRFYRCFESNGSAVFEIARSVRDGETIFKRRKQMRYGFGIRRYLRFGFARHGVEREVQRYGCRRSGLRRGYSVNVIGVIVKKIYTEKRESAAHFVT